MRVVLYFWILSLALLIQVGCSGTGFLGNKKSQPATVSSSEESSVESSSSEPDPDPGPDPDPENSNTVEVCMYYDLSQSEDQEKWDCNSDGSGKVNACHHCDDKLSVKINKGSSKTYNYSNLSDGHTIPGTIFSSKISSKDSFTIETAFKTKGSCHYTSMFGGHQLCRGSHVVVKIRAKTVKDGKTTYSYYSQGSSGNSGRGGGEKDYKSLTIGGSETFNLSDFTSSSSQHSFGVDGCN